MDQKQPPRQFSKITVLFFQEQPFYNFPGRSICSSNRHEFSRRVYMFFEQIQIFQDSRRAYRKDRSSHRDSFRKYLFFFSRSNFFIIFQEGPFVPRTDMNFPGGFICSSNRHEFSRRVYNVLRTDTNFPGGLIEKTCFFKEGLSVCRTDLINSSN